MYTYIYVYIHIYIYIHIYSPCISIDTGYLNICLNIYIRIINTFVNDQNLKSKIIPFLCVHILSSITQIVVTCAFSVQVCVLRCTVRIDKEKAVNFYICFFVCVIQEG